MERTPAPPDDRPLAPPAIGAGGGSQADDASWTVPPLTGGSLSASLLATARPPSYPGPAPPAPTGGRPADGPPAEPFGSGSAPSDALPRLDKGGRIDDFEVVEILGNGAFGVVYLARQLSLDRAVALKVTANHGSEGRTLARLEHPHIVTVYSEKVDESGDLRLLCMQLAPGASLRTVMDDLKTIRRVRRGMLGQGHATQGQVGPEWTGADYLASVDTHARVRASLDTAALRDRELLARADAVEATAWIGARLAEAIHHAHQQGVLHRDIKPANVLVNQYGQPMLADFNISQERADTAQETLGGTLAYMAPEHVEALHPEFDTTASQVGERADLYGLGLVLEEMLTGQIPFAPPSHDLAPLERLRRIAEDRRRGPTPWAPSLPSAEKTLRCVLSRSIAPNEELRPASGEALAASLDGCLALREAERRFPRPGWLTRAALRRPIVWLLIAALAPQLVGSAVNITYNTTEIVTKLTEPQQREFVNVLMIYNLVAYTFAAAVGWRVLRPVVRAWRAMSGARPPDARLVDEGRRAALRAPLWLLMLAAVGWLPGGVLFPLVIHADNGPLAPHVFAHFLTSFTLSGLIAAAYSFGAVQHVATRALYPRLWVDPARCRETARRELAGVPWRLRLMQWLSGSVPLGAAAVLLLVAPDEANRSLRVLVAALIVVGMIGYQYTAAGARRMTRVRAALTGLDE
ncbi:serine/threonine-protein kinase [Pseudobythopirellula maris]|nr:serine/threonine-protein kinase [Pseudobythopirellula maris]